MSEPRVESAEVIARLESCVGRLTLNRPKALHALTLGMCEAMIQHLSAWIDNPRVKLVLIDHSGERGFCAGGDIRMLADSGADDGAAARSFFFAEYRLNALLMAYPKPVAVIMDGVVMGGGVGISLPCGYRIATERTAFAMPESGIGLFPDVGGGWHLPRLRGETGLWLALTGARIKAADCAHLGLANHYVQSSSLETLKAGVIENVGKVESLLAEHAANPGRPPIAEHQAAIDRIFSADSVDEIFARLEADGGDWAMAQLEALRTKSPRTLKVAFRQLRTGRILPSFAANMVMEYRIASRLVVLPDFREGVRAVIIDKDNAPRWSPSTLEGVSDAELDAIFAPLPPGEEWTPLEPVA